MQKGKISSFGAKDANGLFKEAKVLPNTESGMPTRFLTIPWYLRGSMGNLEINTEVVFETFDDLTGYIVGRFNGEWDGVIPYELTTEKGLTVANNIQSADAQTNVIESLNSHVHGNGNNGADTTGPKNGGSSSGGSSSNSGSNSGGSSSGGIVTVDSVLSDNSENPVQNKVIKTALDSKQDIITDLDSIRGNASSAVQPSDLSPVATSGSYNDLSDKPVIPSKTSELINDSDFITSSLLQTVNNATLTIQQNGTTVNTFTANSSTNKTVNITVPTNNNQLTNGMGYITEEAIPVVSYDAVEELIIWE